MNIYQSRIQPLFQSSGLSDQQLEQAIGLPRGILYDWKTGRTKSYKKYCGQIASYFRVSTDYLLGNTDDPRPAGQTAAPLPSNVIPMPEMKKIPLVGQIACGTPILAEQNIEEYIDLPAHIHADYALTCKGDSMINIGIRDGDIVYIRQQAEVENGQVAAVMVGDEEATLKRFYRDGSLVQLIAENSAIPPKAFVGEETQQLRILGLAVAYTHIIN